MDQSHPAPPAVDGARPGDALRIGPLAGPLPNVRRIAVLRGGGLGDLLFTLPALQSLRDAYPDATLTLLGTPEHARLLADRPSPVHEVLVLPPARGVYEPAGGPPHADSDQEAARSQQRFFDQARHREFDLAVQLHGGGRWSNPFLRRLGARWTVGPRTPDAATLDRWLPYRLYQHEVLRGLEVVGLAGAPPTQLCPRLAVTAQDLSEADEALHELPRPLLVIHPGASDPRRRWPAENFAAVAVAAADRGGGVAVVGGGAEAGLVEQVVRRARDQLPADRRFAVRSLAGVLSPSGLVGVLTRGNVLLANDSGPRHLADAVGTPTTAIFWMGNAINAAPFGRARHRVHLSWTAACPVCGANCTDPNGRRCEHDVSFVADVPLAAVLDDVAELLTATERPTTQLTALDGVPR
ncbi:glycosyltransferase family 9 protein [Goodfellowiella coeruleoviolacea]|nr:glycosyltransferase family 9 protein [Goodfellowiella coeruleoviolacea]